MDNQSNTHGPMSGYIRIAKWEKYQHYKYRSAPWVKLYVSLADPQHKINQLPVPTRLLFDRLLLLAMKNENATPNDYELLAKILRMESEDVREGLAQLLKGRWIQVTKTPRRASKPSSNDASDIAPPEAVAEAGTKPALAAVPTSTSTFGNLGGSTARLLEGISGERQYELDRLAAALTGADDESRNVLCSYGRDVPLSVLSDLRERVEFARHSGKPFGFGYAINALKGEAA